MSRRLLFWCCVGFTTFQCLSHVAFTNLKCNFFNRTYGEYQACAIKAVNRTHKYISIYGKLYYKPVVNLMIRLQLLRSDHGYKPFFIDLTFDACKYLRNPNNPLVSMFYRTFRDCSNLNHTCPYDHDFIVDKLWTGNYDDDWSRYLPLPNGDYLIITSYNTNNIDFTKVKVYFKITA